MEIDRSYVNTLANDKSETLSLTETELRLVDNTKVCYHCGSNNHKKMVQLMGCGSVIARIARKLFPLIYKTKS